MSGFLRLHLRALQGSPVCGILHHGCQEYEQRGAQRIVEIFVDKLYQSGVQSAQRIAYNDRGTSDQPDFRHGGDTDE